MRYVWICLTAALLSAFPGKAQDRAAPVDDPSTITLKPASLPASAFASNEAKAAMIRRAGEEARRPAAPAGDITKTRAFWTAFNNRLLVKMTTAYATRTARGVLGGVSIDDVVPTTGIARDKSDKVLINLHGGAYMWGAGSGALIEAIPIAATGGYRVVTVDYSLAPEHRYPAASEDVAAVYRALLKTYRPENIGIYGCSAGGALTAQATAWIIASGLPRPGAIGTFCGTGLPFGGDSAVLGALATGQPPMNPDIKGSGLSYLAGISINDERAYPGNAPKLLAKFPPTLMIAGTRDFALSSLTVMDRRLRQVDVATELVLFDGLGHAFFIDPDLPESREVYGIVTRFFERYLGMKK